MWESGATLTETDITRKVSDMRRETLSLDRLIPDCGHRPTLNDEEDDLGSVAKGNEGYE